jgi:hypothetical protein
MLNKNITEAVERAVREEGQSPELASKILAWMQNLSDNNESITNSSDYIKRCALCFEHVTLTNSSEDGN